MALGDDLAVAAVLLLLVIFLFVAVLLQLCFDACYRRRDLASSSSSSQSARWRRGGDTEALPSPAVTVCRTAARSKEEDGDAAAECAVCLAGLEDGEEARIMPCCRHGFHAQCVATWLAVASRPTCPLCRIAVARPGVAASAPASSSALPPVPPEPANYAAYLPTARFSDQGAC
ncbi:unnamed protein product [Urochloa humidicola]